MINEIQPKVNFQNIVQCPFNTAKMITSNKKREKNVKTSLFTF